MNKVVEVLLTVLALVGLFSVLPKSAPANTAISPQQTVVGDGSDPMPLCRGRRCP